MNLSVPFLPKGLASTPSLMVICWSSWGKFSTTEQPLMERILLIVSAALKTRFEDKLFENIHGKNHGLINYKDTKP